MKSLSDLVSEHSAKLTSRLNNSTNFSLLIYLTSDLCYSFPNLFTIFAGYPCRIFLAFQVTKLFGKVSSVSQIKLEFVAKVMPHVLACRIKLLNWTLTRERGTVEISKGKCLPGKLFTLFWNHIWQKKYLFWKNQWTRSLFYRNSIPSSGIFAENGSPKGKHVPN